MDNKKSELTRDLSLSMYFNPVLRNQIIEFIEDKNRAVVESPGVSGSIVAHHAFEARDREQNFNYALSVPAALLALIIYRVVSTDGETLEIDGLGWIICLCFAALYLITLRRYFTVRNFLHKTFVTGWSKSEPVSNDYQQAIKAFEQKIGKNIVCYSGYSPFVGSGIDMGGWSMVIDTDKGKNAFGQTREPEDFNVETLYETIEDELKKTNIPELSIYDKIFINGKCIKKTPLFLPDPYSAPVGEVDEAYLKESVNSDSNDTRFYKVIQLTGWDGDLVVSAFFRLRKDEKTLFIENNYYLLPPVHDLVRAHYRDLIKSKDEFLWAIKRIFVSVPSSLLYGFAALVKMLAYLFSAVSKALNRKDEIRDNPDFDYGASTSLRETVANDQYNFHFQKLDKEKYLKIVEKRIFNAIVDFLSQKGIDVSELKDREASILNQGVIVNGGNLTSQNLAVGSGSNVKIKGQKQRKNG